MTIVTVPTPSVATLISLTAEIEALKEQRTFALRNLIDDCEFMDIPVLQLYYFHVRENGHASPGDVFHITDVHHEWKGGHDETTAHLAASCDHEWCRPGDRVKFPKHHHVGNRTFYTRRADHVLAGIETVVEPKMFGELRPIDVYTFIPVVSERAR